MVKDLITTAMAALVIATSAAFAADPSEKGVPTSPLAVYSGGIAAGAFSPLSDSLSAERSMFVKLTFMNTFYFRNNMSLFLDINWFGPGNSYGADLGFDFVPFEGDIRPFIGAGVGAHFFDKNGTFGDNFGPSGTVHAGVLVDITETVQLKVRVPFHIVGNETLDNGAGLDIGMMFGSKLRHVKKLDYYKQ